MSRYDDARYFTRQSLHLAGTGLTVAGTAASDTELMRVVINDNITIDKAMAYLVTGGTAAGPIVKLGYSLAGTGAVTAFGTITHGTNADKTNIAAAGVTAQAFVSGDHLVLVNSAGTVAATPKVIINIGFRETYV